MPPIDFETRIENCRLLSIWSTAALAMVLVANWLIRGAETADIDVLGVQLLPLFLFWPGLNKGKTRSYFWLNVVLMLYMVKAITAVPAAPMPSLLAVLAILELAVTITLFFATYYFIRWIMRRKKAAAAETDTAV